jgi:hypothetical protein
MTNKNVSIKFIVNTAEAKKAVREFNSEMTSMKQQQALKDRGLRVTPKGALKRIGSDKILDPQKVARTEFKKGQLEAQAMEKKKIIADQEKAILKKKIQDQKMFNKNHAHAKKKEMQLEKEGLKLKRKVAAQERQVLQEKESAQRKFATRSLQRNLSGMFFWMQVARVSNQALRSMSNTYKTATQGNSDLDKSTTGLSAAWEFLKFSIVNALNTEWVFAFISGVKNAVDWTSNLINEHEWLGAAIFGAFALLFVGGTIAMGLHQFLLWYNTFFMAKILAGTQATVGTSAATSGITGAFATMMSALKVMLGAGLILYVAYDIFKNGPNQPLTTSTLIKRLGLATIGGFMLGGPWGALAAFAITFVVSLQTEDARKKMIEMNEAFAKDPATRSAEEAYLTGYQGTIVPPEGQSSWLDDATNNPVSLNIDDMMNNIQGLHGALGNNGPWTTFGGNVISYGVDPLAALDDELVTHSVVPSLGLLGLALNLNATTALPMFGIALSSLTSMVVIADDSIKALTDSINNIPKETHVYIYKHIVTDSTSTD